MIPLSEPTFLGNEWVYVKECLDSSWVSSVGKFVTQFENNIAAYTGVKHAVACVNGTAALQVSLQIVGVEPDDEVIVPALTFIAPVNAIRYLHAWPVFMDCDPFYCLDTQKTCLFIETETVFRNGYTYNKKTNRRISAIVPVHVFGHAVCTEKWIELCRERNIKIVEDATEGLGTWYTEGLCTGKHVGTVGDVGCLSFNGNKMITTGGGGMILTNDSDIAKRAYYLTTQAKDDAERFVHHEVGYNFRLTNLQAALGVAQLEQLSSFLETRREHYLFYRSRIQEISGLKIADQPPYCSCNNWMVALQIDSAQYGKNREQLMAYLKNYGVQSRPVWYLNHLQKPYLACESFDIVQALHLVDITLNIPNGVLLTAANRDLVVEALCG